MAPLRQWGGGQRAPAGNANPIGIQASGSSICEASRSAAGRGDTHVRPSLHRVVEDAAEDDLASCLRRRAALGGERGSIDLGAL